MRDFLSRDGCILATMFASLLGGYFTPGIALFVNRFDLVRSRPGLFLTVGGVVGILISTVLRKILDERLHSLTNYVILGGASGTIGVALGVLAVLII